jgi:hypothetical protein
MAVGGEENVDKVCRNRINTCVVEIILRKAVTPRMKQKEFRTVWQYNKIQCDAMTFH